MRYHQIQIRLEGIELVLQSDKALQRGLDSPLDRIRQRVLCVAERAEEIVIERC